MNSGPLTACYVLSADRDGIYGLLTLASALSLRLSNPDIIIVILIDNKSHPHLKSVLPQLANLVDILKYVETPDGTAIFRNRWIKTQLVSYTAGPTIFLDSDTIVRKPIGDLLSSVEYFGAVPNLNSNSPKSQLWDDDADELDRLGWSTSCEFYPNGGVFFFQMNQQVTNLFDAWHSKWLENINKTGRTRDQPSLYSALTEVDIPITLLPHEYNFQDVHFKEPSNKSKIIHYYGKYTSLDNPLGKFINLHKYIEYSKFEGVYLNIIRDQNKWPNNDIIARIMRKYFCDKPFSILWSCNFRLKSVNLLLTKCFNKILKPNA